MKPTIGIISTGRFATVLKKLFSRTDEFSVLQSSRRKPVDGRTIFPLSQVLACDIIFLCIPISSLEQFLRNHGNEIRTDSLVVDVCSVKQLPVKWMETLLPSTVDILATHPVFGPFSTQNGSVFTSLPWTIWPVRISNQPRVEALLSFLRSQSLRLIPMDPKTHDHIMANSQAVAFLFGTIGVQLGLKAGPLDTKGFSLILQNQRSVQEDSKQLFLDMFHFNPEARTMITNIQQTITGIEKSL